MMRWLWFGAVILWPLVCSDAPVHLRPVEASATLAERPLAETALAQLPKTPPDVVPVDLQLPGMSSAELIAKLRAVCPEVQCLVLTMYAENDLIFETLKAGACGYLLKRTNPAEIADAIRQVHADGSVMTPRIA